MTMRTLGRTGLRVNRMGIGPSYGISADGLLEAFDHGINYFYFGTLRTAAMASAVKKITSESGREKLVVAVQSYTRWAPVLSRSVDAALRKLNLDYADVLLLGKVDKPLSSAMIEQVLRIKEKRKIRFVAISAHQRKMFQEHLKLGVCDIIMTRYNAAHTGSETEVFPLLPPENRPGVISYTATRWGTLLQEVPGEKTPRASDCYGFVLNHPDVDVCLCGPKNRTELQEAFVAMNAPPMSEDELAWMRRVGQTVYHRQHHNFLLRKLIFD